jgi:TRAP transporter TAXI family solute receptor
MAVAEIITKHYPNILVTAMPTQGSNENMNLLEVGELDIGICNSDTVWNAYNGKGNYPEAIQTYQIMTTHANQSFYVTLERSGIKTLAEIEGHAISVGAVGSGGYDSVYTKLNAIGLWDKIKRVNLEYTDAAEAMRDGTVDGMNAYCSSYSPVSFLAELDSTRSDVVILGFSDEQYEAIKANEPYVTRVILTKENTGLRNMKKGEEYIAVANSGHFVCRPEVPEDVVYAFVKAFYENAPEIDSYHRIGKTIRIETALKGACPDVPFHPGAVKYFKEAGVWDENLPVGEAKS